MLRNRLFGTIYVTGNGHESFGTWNARSSRAMGVWYGFIWARISTNGGGLVNITISLQVPQKVEILTG
jgi:hypothetical protein